MKTVRRILNITAAVTVLFLAAVSVSHAKRQQFDSRDLTAANLQTETLQIVGIEWRTMVHVPPAYNQTMPVAVVLMFDGGGGTSEITIKETGWIQKANSAGFIAVFPEATCPDMTQPAKFGRNNPTWIDGSGRFHSGEGNVSDVTFTPEVMRGPNCGRA